MSPLEKWKVFGLSTTFAIFLLVLGGAFDTGAVWGSVQLPGDTGLPEIVSPPDDLDNPGSGRNDGTRAWAGALQTITGIIKILVGAIALAYIVWSAIKIISGGADEENLSEGKRGVVWGILALTFVLLIDPIILNVLYGGGDIDPGSTMKDSNSIRESVGNGVRLLLEAIAWAEAIIVIVAVGYIIFSGLNMITALGNTEEISKHRNNLLFIGAGIVVILLGDIIVREVIYPLTLGDDLSVQYEPDATEGINQIAGLIKYFLQFLAVIAFLAILYGGILMVGSFGNEDRVATGKRVLIGAAIGIVIILSSYALVATVISGEV